MKWMLNVWFSIILFIFACLCSLIAQVTYEYYFFTSLIFIIICCLLSGCLLYVAHLHRKNNNKKLSRLNDTLFLVLLFINSYISLTSSVSLVSPQHQGRFKSASDQ